jgi:hypothetical protein
MYDVIYQMNHKINYLEREVEELKSVVWRRK